MLLERPLYTGTPSVYVHASDNGKHYHIDHTLWSIVVLVFEFYDLG